MNSSKPFHMLCYNFVTQWCNQVNAWTFSCICCTVAALFWHWSSLKQLPIIKINWTEWRWMEWSTFFWGEGGEEGETFLSFEYNLSLFQVFNDRLSCPLIDNVSFINGELISRNLLRPFLPFVFDWKKLKRRVSLSDNQVDSYLVSFSASSCPEFTHFHLHFIRF